MNRYHDKTVLASTMKSGGIKHYGPFYVMVSYAKLIQ